MYKAVEAAAKTGHLGKTPQMAFARGEGAGLPPPPIKFTRPDLKGVTSEVTRDENLTHWTIYSSTTFTVSSAGDEFLFLFLSKSVPISPRDSGEHATSHKLVKILPNSG